VDGRRQLAGAAGLRVVDDEKMFHLLAGGGRGWWVVEYTDAFSEVRS
jgi:hypothetical protein